MSISASLYFSESWTSGELWQHWINIIMCKFYSMIQCMVSINVQYLYHILQIWTFWKVSSLREWQGVKLKYHRTKMSAWINLVNKIDSQNFHITVIVFFISAYRVHVQFGKYLVAHRHYLWISKLADHMCHLPLFGQSVVHLFVCLFVRSFVLSFIDRLCF